MSILLALGLSLALSPAAVPSAQEGDLSHAPPPREVDGLPGVAIDVLDLQASVLFDLSAREATAVAKLRFRVGSRGMPLFDLRQPIEQASLDGKELAPAALAEHELGGGAGRMRVLEHVLEPGQEHLLRLRYRLRTPDAAHVQPIGWAEGRLDWDFFFSDLDPGRYLEMWFPANLIYDHFSFQLEIRLLGAREPHLLISNGDSERLGAGHWRVRFPADFTAFSPMLVIAPTSSVLRSREELSLPEGRRVTLDLMVRKAAQVDPEHVRRRVERVLAGDAESIGPWPHGKHCTVFLWTLGRAMEYDGGTTSDFGSLEHELFHSWFGRGLKPVSQNDGWIDEAWDVYRTSPWAARMKDPGRGSPVELASRDPWNRTTSGLSYSAGLMVFVRLAHHLGDAKLRERMVAFYRAHLREPISTDQLRDFLAGPEKDPEVFGIFARYVRGEDRASE